MTQLSASASSHHRRALPQRQSFIHRKNNTQRSNKSINSITHARSFLSVTMLIVAAVLMNLQPSLTGSERIDIHRMDTDDWMTIDNRHKTKSKENNVTSSTRTLNAPEAVSAATVGQGDIGNLAVGDPTARTLALLYPSGLMGGYRNQAMRFVAFVKHAVDKNITQLLLPSIVWSTMYDPAKNYDESGSGSAFRPVRMAELFDIDHWNRYAMATSFTNQRLPLLASSIEKSDCWHPRSEDDLMRLRQTFLAKPEDPKASRISPLAMELLEESMLLSPIYNETAGLLLGMNDDPKALRLMDLRDKVQHCQHPIVHGGGTGRGVLWEDYMTMSALQEDVAIKQAKIAATKASGKKDRPRPGFPRKQQLARQNAKLISSIHQALVPAPQWRQMANQCVQNHLVTKNETETTILKYIALHARVEVDMLAHPCSWKMEMNLTNILNMVDDFTKDYNNGGAINATFLAISRGFMQIRSESNEYLASVQDLIDGNWKTLNDRSSSSYFHYTTESHHVGAGGNDVTHPTIFECGEGWTDSYYKENPHSKNLGSILPSIIDFYIAVQAEVFIGAAKSSWSRDVWTARYHQGKGNANYEYTPNGILQLANGGLPSMHKGCGGPGGKGQNATAAA